MVNQIHRINSCVGAFYFEILLFLLVVFVCRKKYYLPLFFLLMVSWRFFFKIESSRYCVLFLFLLFYLFIIESSVKTTKITPKTKVLICISFLLLTKNFIATFSSFRNNYIIDLQENVKSLYEDHSKKIVYIDKSEYYRILNEQTIVPSSAVIAKPLDDSYSIDKLMEDVDYINRDMYFFAKDGYGFQFDLLNKTQTKIPNILHNQRILSCKTNKKNRSISVYRINNFQSSINIDRIISQNKKIFKGDSYSLCAYEPVYDVYVLYKDRTIYWLIGTEVKEGTEIVLQIHTNEHNLLPADRIKYRFDNLGIKFKKQIITDVIDGYSVIVQKIPGTYSISRIRVGYYTKGHFLWTRVFELT